MTAINPELRKIFETSFEELSVTDPRPPDFSMWGKSYLGKWKQHTMTMFLNDLNDLVQGMEDEHTLKVDALNKECEQWAEQAKGERAAE